MDTALNPALVWFSAIIILLLMLVGTVTRLAAHATLIRLADASPGESFWSIWRASGRRYRMGWTGAVWHLALVQFIVSLGLAPLWGACLLPALIPLGRDAFSLAPIAPGRAALAIGIAMLGASIAYLPASLVGGWVNLVRRAIVLEDLSAFAGMRRGWLVLRAGAKELISLWLLMAALELGYLFVALPVAAGLAIAGEVLAWLIGIPLYFALQPVMDARLAFGLVVLLGLVIMFLLLGLPMLVIDGLWSTYNSIAWTKTYRGLSRNLP
jgi:hypothetical protein